MHLLHNALFVDYKNVDTFLRNVSEKYFNMPEYTERMCDADMALAGGILKACDLWTDNTESRCVE